MVVNSRSGRSTPTQPEAAARFFLALR